MQTERPGGVVPFERKDVLVIGGGVIGVSCAYYLAKRGMSVSIVEKNEGCSGCSCGNAGLIVPGHSIPLPTPGVVAAALKWMFDGQSPFYIKPRLDLELISWLCRFVLASRRSRLQSSVKVLSDLTLASIPLYEALAESSAIGFGYEQKGRLGLYLNRKGLEGGQWEARLLQQFGVKSDYLDAAGVHNLEPATLPTIWGGIHFPDDCHLTPEELVRSLEYEVARWGGATYSKTEVLGFGVEGKRISLVKTNRGEFTAKLIVLAAGSWSSELARWLQTSLPLQPARGYSVTAWKTGISPAIPLLLGDTKVAITPMGRKLRVAGTLELTGFDQSIDQGRVASMLNSVRHYIRTDVRFNAAETWSGLRPCTPDGLPVVGWSDKYNNLIIATGHATLGITLGPITGKLVSQIACSETPTVDLGPLRIGRFH